MHTSADISDSKSVDSYGDNSFSEDEVVDHSTSRWRKDQHEMPPPVVCYSCNSEGKLLDCALKRQVSPRHKRVLDATVAGSKDTSHGTVPMATNHCGQQPLTKRGAAKAASSYYYEPVSAKLY